MIYINFCYSISINRKPNQPQVETTHTLTKILGPPNFCNSSAMIVLYSELIDTIIRIIVVFVDLVCKYCVDITKERFPVKVPRGFDVFQLTNHSGSYGNGACRLVESVPVQVDHWKKYKEK